MIKKVLIISPQPWSKLKVSKHHYAIELAKKGNTVFFLNPPSPSISYGHCYISGKTEEGVNIVDYRPLFPMRWKFKLNALFNICIRLEVKKLLKVIGGRPDVVWDFEPNRQFADLSVFGSAVKIYHPVDVTAFLNGNDKKADIIFSVADVILDFFSHSKVPRFFVNHGLNTVFKNKAVENLRTDAQFSYTHTKVRAGYIGNLLMNDIDHTRILSLVKTYSDIEFHFWGPYDVSIIPDGSPDKESLSQFVQELKICPNVVLYGLASQDEISNGLSNIDVFFWCKDQRRDLNKGSNSHKLLEYLSTGKVIVSTKLLLYNDRPELIVCAETANEFIDLFGKIVRNLEYYNNVEFRRRRISLALDNTYERQMERIEDLISQNVKQ